MGSFVPRGGVFDGPGIAYAPYAQDYWGAAKRRLPAWPPTGHAVPMRGVRRRVGFRGMGIYPGALPVTGGITPSQPITEKPGPGIATALPTEMIGRGGTLFTPVFPCPVTRAPMLTNKGERGGIFDGPYVPCDYDTSMQAAVPKAIRTLPLPSGATALEPVPEAGVTPKKILPTARPLYQKTFTIGPEMPSLSPPAAPTGLKLLPAAGFGAGPDGIGCCG